MQQSDRILINQAARKPCTVYLGRDVGGTQYVVDDRDALPPDVVVGTFNIGRIDCTGTALVAAVETTENEGTPVCLQIGDVYYETA